MKETDRLRQEIAILDQSIQKKVKLVSRKLELARTLQDIEEDAAELTRLLGMRRYKDSLLSGLEGRGAPASLY